MHASLQIHFVECANNYGISACQCCYYFHNAKKLHNHEFRFRSPLARIVYEAHISKCFGDIESGPDPIRPDWIGYCQKLHMNLINTRKVIHQHIQTHTHTHTVCLSLSLFRLLWMCGHNFSLTLVYSQSLLRSLSPTSHARTALFSSQLNFVTTTKRL